jgi:hypothetical protein
MLRLPVVLLLQVSKKESSLMLDTQKFLVDLAQRIGVAEERASRQQMHIERLSQDGHDAADAVSLLELMASTLDQMREVETTFSGFRSGPEARCDEA